MSYCSVSGPGGRESQDVLEEDILYATPVIVGPKVDFDNAFSKSTYNLFVPPPLRPLVQLLIFRQCPPPAFRTSGGQCQSRRQAPSKF